MADVAPSSYDGFLSYSHAADDLLAPRLQAGLQRFAKPWWKRRALRVFRDEASLSANPHLWSSITDALDDSGWFVLLLSPDAARSEWVNREIDYWKEHRDPQKILPVVTDGSFGWSDGEVAGDAVPESLRGVFSDEPRWVDLRFARSETQLDLRHTRFRDVVADVAAAVRGVAKDELVSEEIRQHRRTIRTAWTAGVVILALGIAATVGAVAAVDQSNQAQAQRDQAQQERDRAVAAEETASEERDRASQEADRANLLADQEASARAEAEANAALARSRQLAASAINVLDDDPELSVLLALQAAQGADPAFESVSALHEALQSHRTSRTITWPSDWVMDPAVAGSISPDGRYVAASGARHQLAVWDLEKGSTDPEWLFEVPYPEYAVILPYFTNDGSSVVATVAWFNRHEPPELWPEPPPDVGVYVLDAETGDVIRHIRGPRCPIIGLFQTGRFFDVDRLVGAASPSAENCFLGSGDADMWLLDLRTGEFEVGYEEPVFSWLWGTPASLAEDGRYLGFIDGFNSMVVNLETGEEVFEAPGGEYSQLSRDGSLLLAAGKTSFSVWDIRSDTRLWGADSPSPLNDVTFSEDEELVYATGWDGVVRIWQAETGSLVTELKGHRSLAWFLSMTTDNALVASFSADRTGRVWDLSAKGRGEITGFDLPGVPVLQSGNFIGDRGAVLLYPETDAAVALGGPSVRFIEPGVAAILSTTSGDIEYLFEGYGAQMVRLSPDGSLLAGQPFVAPGVLGPVHIRDVDSGEVLVELEDLCTYDNENRLPGQDCPSDPGALGDYVTSMCFSPDGSMLAIAGLDSGQTGVWDVATGRRLTWLTVGVPALQSGNEIGLWFSPASDLLVAGASKLAVFEPAGWSESASFPIDSWWFDLLFFRDKPQIVGLDPVVGIVRVDTDTWEYVGDPLLGHEGVVFDIDMNDDESLIASAGSDGLVRIWSALTGDLLQAIPLGDTTVNFVHFIDNRHVLVVPQGQPALIMTVDIPELIDIARSRITRGFADDECDTYHIDPCPDLETIQGG